MKKVFLSVGIIILGLSVTATAKSNIRFGVAPSVMYTFGETEYIMDITYLSNGHIMTLKSQLEFPLDGMMAGMTARMYCAQQKLYTWSVEVAYYRNINDPGGIMKDHDWMTDTLTWSVYKFSYTESDATMKSRLATLDVTLRVYQHRSFHIDLWGGIRYQKIEQDIIGYEGWQYDTAGVRHDISGTEKAMEYEVTYKTPHLGLQMEVGLEKASQLRLRAGYAMVWTSDVDDHVLRYKVATSDIKGNGFLGGVNFFHQVIVSEQLRWFFDLFGNVSYFHAQGNQVQRWYGDDPATPSDDTGYILSGIPHEINSTQAQLGVKLGVLF